MGTSREIIRYKKAQGGRKKYRSYRTAGHLSPLLITSLPETPNSIKQFPADFKQKRIPKMRMSATGCFS